MRFIIYGAGAIGGVIGARLHAHGHEVILIARGAHLTALRERGLTLIAPDERTTLSIPAVGHPREIAFRDDDVVLLAMKTQDTPAALDALSACADNIPVVCAQNGVANERMAARRFERVYGMFVWLPATFLKPGEVICHAAPTGGVLDSGRFPQGSDALIRDVTGALDKSGFSARPEENIMRWKYHKLLRNLWNALNAVLGPGFEAKGFAERVQAEALACYAAEGIDWASDAEAAARRKGSGVHVRPIEGQPQLVGSSWQSMVRQLGSIETDFLNGEIVLMGKRQGVPTPCNRALQLAANRMVRSGAQPGALTLADLERLANA